MVKLYRKTSTSSSTSYQQLIIVESPSKCSKIESFLNHEKEDGQRYRCLATCGHLRELTSLESITDFRHPVYTIMESKRQQIAILKEATKNHQVILATDDDREGETIAWHVCDLLGLSVDITPRIVFHEITQEAVQLAIRTPRKLNMNVVKAQQARQIVDLLVGYSISPALWRAFPKQRVSTSAGRCQTPALRLVYDNQVKRETSPATWMYQTVGTFTNKRIPFRLNKVIETKAEAHAFLISLDKHKFKYHCTEPRTLTLAPPVPLSTSTLQQRASDVLHISPAETMRIAQQLYESGFITYMRTDSHVLSTPFVLSCRKWIETNYGCPFLGDTYPSSSENEGENENENENEKTQEAHEAIRPTHVEWLSLSPSAPAKERKLYELIWRTSVQSCMKESTMAEITATMDTPEKQETTKFECKAQRVLFAGWKQIEPQREKGVKGEKVKSVNEEKEKEEYKTNNIFYDYLRALDPSLPGVCHKVVAEEHCLYHTPHLSESQLVKALEQRGIGRPSTFASLVDKIQERQYVEKGDIEGETRTCTDLEWVPSLASGNIKQTQVQRFGGQETKKLVLQDLGLQVSEYLQTHFNSLFDYEYTNKMEMQLDLVAKGEADGFEICGKCKQDIQQLLLRVRQEEDEERKDKEDEERKDKEDEERKDKEDEERKDKEKPLTKKKLGYWEGKLLYIQKGKFGLYVSWGENTLTLSSLGNRPLDNITFSDVEPLLIEKQANFRQLSATLSVRKGQRGLYLCHLNAKKKSNKPDFYSIAKYEGGNIMKDDVRDVKQWARHAFGIE